MNFVMSVLGIANKKKMKNENILHLNCCLSGDFCCLDHSHCKRLLSSSVSWELRPSDAQDTAPVPKRSLWGGRTPACSLCTRVPVRIRHKDTDNTPSPTSTRPVSWSLTICRLHGKKHVVTHAPLIRTFTVNFPVPSLN